MAFAVFDDGGGARLFAGQPASFFGIGIEKWDGASWSMLERGINYRVNALAVSGEGGARDDVRRGATSRSRAERRRAASRSGWHEAGPPWAPG